MAFDNLKIDSSKEKSKTISNIEKMLKKFETIENGIVENEIRLEKSFTKYNDLINEINDIHKEFNDYKEDITTIRNDILKKLKNNIDILDSLDSKRLSFLEEIESKGKVLKLVARLSKSNDKSLKMIIALNLITIPFTFYVLYKLFL